MSRDLLEHDCSVKGYIKLNAFSGGVERLRCVQITVPIGGYAQMTFQEAKTLFADCIKAIEECEKEYDKNPPWWETLAKSR